MRLRPCLLVLFAAAAAFAQAPAYLDPSEPLERRVDDLLSRLTLAEKFPQLCTTAPAIERLKVPVMNGWNQCLYGVVWTRPTTMFPKPVAMAATWDTALVHNVASVIADEARAVYNLWPTVPGPTEPGTQGQLVTVAANGDKLRHNGLVYRAPVINISRDPRWGRVEEAWGEDPFLTSRMAVAFVKGMQGDDPRYLKTAATLKHYAVNNQEKDRVTLSASVNERMLMEYWLPHFKAGIVEAKAQSVMASYNAINGVPLALNKMMLIDILRNQWKFDGFVVPDSVGVERLITERKLFGSMEEAAAQTVLAGCDLDNAQYPAVLPKALARGLLTEKDLDQALRRVLRVRYRLGEFDPPAMVPYSRISPAVIDSAEHRELALRTARESIVLLTNRNRFLPLDRSEIKTIAVIGPHADVMTTGGYSGLASKFVKPLDGIRNRVAPGTQVLYARGSDFSDARNKEPGFAEAVAAARKADVAVVYVGLNRDFEREALDRTDLGLPPVQEDLIEKIFQANPNTVVVLLNGGPLSVRWAKDNVPAVVEMFYGGEEGGNAVADVLFGDYNPAGRLPYTVYESLDQVPPMSEYDITKGFTYMYFPGKPLYPFGHGLSYTEFRYSNLKVAPARLAGNGQLTVSLEVRNAGKRAGDEVVQLYVHDLHASVQRPIRELRGFERVSLKPGESRRVIFALPAARLAFYDVKSKSFVVEPGDFDVMVGSSSEDIRARARFQVTTPGKFAN